MIVVKLEEQDSVKSFDCGDDDLNDFILHESPLYRKEKLAVTYVLKEADDLANEHIKAFFSLSNDRISISDFDSKTKYNRFSRRFNNHKRLKSYPAAIPFYLRNGFVPLNEEDADEPTRLLYFDLNDCRRTHAVALLRPQRLGRRLTATPPPLYLSNKTKPE